MADVLHRTLSDLVLDLPIVVDPDGLLVAVDLTKDLDELGLREELELRGDLFLQRLAMFDHDLVLPVLLTPGGQGRSGLGAMAQI